MADFTDLAQAQAALADPNLPGPQLALISTLQPTLRAQVAAHPNAYPQLLSFIATNADDAARAIAAQRLAPPAPAAPEAPVAAAPPAADETVASAPQEPVADETVAAAPQEPVDADETILRMPAEPAADETIIPTPEAAEPLEAEEIAPEPAVAEAEPATPEPEEIAPAGPVFAASPDLGQPFTANYPPDQVVYPPDQVGYPSMPPNYPPAQTAYPPAQAAYPPAPPVYPPPPGGPAGPYGFPLQQRKSKNGLIFGIIGAVVVAAAGVGLYLWQPWAGGGHSNPVLTTAQVEQLLTSTVLESLPDSSDGWESRSVLLDIPWTGDSCVAAILRVDELESTTYATIDSIDRGIGSAHLVNFTVPVNTDEEFFSNLQSCYTSTLTGSFTEVEGGVVAENDGNRTFYYGSVAVEIWSDPKGQIDTEDFMKRLVTAVDAVAAGKKVP
ncbi:MAG: hypothetical protein LBR20_00205 [Propionibacteriaceae bacterium]|jgi:hypothetical protein|nr:hypothetical protein [Propionibacteriaceae bacterium]